MDSGSEISIVLCVFGDKQSENTILCDERNKETKSNRLVFLCKENSNREGGWGRGRDRGILACGWLQIKRGPV